MAKPDRSKLGLTGDPLPGGTLDSPADRLQALYRECFGTSAGQAVVEDLRKRYGNRRSFVPDSNATAFHEGQRDVFLMILGFMERVNRKPQTQENDD